MTLIGCYVITAFLSTTNQCLIVTHCYLPYNNRIPLPLAIALVLSIKIIIKVFTIRSVFSSVAYRLPFAWWRAPLEIFNEIFYSWIWIWSHNLVGSISLVSIQLNRKFYALRCKNHAFSPSLTPVRMVFIIN